MSILGILWSLIGDAFQVVGTDPATHALRIWAVTVADTGHAWHARTYHHLIPSLVKEHASPLSP